MNGKIISPSVPPSGKNILIGCATVLGVLCICFIVAYAFFNRSSAPDYKTTAYIMCQLQVKNSLKLPSTPKFPASTEINIHDLGNNTFDMDAYVNSQNSFGAMLRTQFYCKDQYIGSDASDTNLNNPNNWNMLQLTFSQ